MLLNAGGVLHWKQEQICEAQNASAKPFTFVQYAEISLYGSGDHHIRKFPHIEHI
jgi:hypothetical protein